MQELRLTRSFAFGVLICSAVSVPVLRAQTSSSLNAVLPDSPGAIALLDAGSESTEMQAGGVPPSIAPRYAATIQADQSAVPLTASGKFVVAARREFGIGLIVSPAISAGYSHLIDSAPHFGTDRGGFGERYGAASYRRAVSIFTTTGLYAAVLRDDPRYYVLGPKQPLKKRLIYAATRAIITRKDNGGSTVNLPEILGVATAQASAIGFYPSRDRTARRVLGGTATSIGIDAALFEWSEFGGQILGHFRHK